MKKLLQSGKIWTIMSILMFIATCSVTVYAAATTPKVNDPWESYKSQQIDKTLTADTWDNLMEKLASLSGNVSNSISSQVSMEVSTLIPKGAVMAFADRSSCPTGWKKFDNAEGRFLMGAVSGIGSVGGNNSVTLTVGNLPSHYHYIAKNKHHYEGENLYEDCGGYHTGEDSVLRAQGTCDANYTLSFITNKEGVKNEADVGRTSPTGNGNSIDITNKYVKVLYCIKE